MWNGRKISLTTRIAGNGMTEREREREIGRRGILLHFLWHRRADDDEEKNEDKKPNNNNM